MRYRQKGMTFIGLLFVLALVGFLVYAGIRLVPVYINYMKVVRTMQSVAAEFKSETADQARIRNSLDKHWGIEDITGVEAKDVEILKDNDVISMHVVYDDHVPYLANISLTAHFDKTVKVE